MDNKDFIKELSVDGKTYRYYDIQQISARKIGDLDRLPFSIRILVENLLRKLDHQVVYEADFQAIANWQPTYDAPVEIPFHPARVLMQDFTVVPAVVDLAAMRDAVRDLGADPSRINPLVPVELIVDHSVLIVLAGKEYGTGSSRDWAAKGTNLLGIRAVLAESYERIHRNNLVGMGVLPLVFQPGDGIAKLGLDGTEIFFIQDIENMTPRKTIRVRAVKPDGKEITFKTTARLDTDVDVAYYQHSGILPYVLRRLMNA